MTLLLSLSLALSLILLLIAAAMERSAILGRINGSNGLFVLVALIVSATASVVLSIIAGWYGGWAVLPAVLAGSALYHWVMAKILVGGLQVIATRTAALGKRNPSGGAGGGSSRY